MADRQAPRPIRFMEVLGITAPLAGCFFLGGLTTGLFLTASGRATFENPTRNVFRNEVRYIEGQEEAGNTKYEAKRLIHCTGDLAQDIAVLWRVVGASWLGCDREGRLTLAGKRVSGQEGAESDTETAAKPGKQEPGVRGRDIQKDPGLRNRKPERDGAQSEVGRKAPTDCISAAHTNLPVCGQVDSKSGSITS